MSDSIKNITNNKKAYHEFFVEEKLECGIELKGTEVKSIRAGAVNLKDSWCDISAGEIFVKGMHVSPYKSGNIFNHDEKRARRLLLHKKEIMRLTGKTAEKGYTLIPLSLYFKNSNVKILVGLCKGKKLYDKRDSAAKKVAERDIERAVKLRG